MFLIWRLGCTEYYAPLVVMQIISGVLLVASVSGKLAGLYLAGSFTALLLMAVVADARASYAAERHEH